MNNHFLGAAQIITQGRYGRIDNFILGHFYLQTRFVEIIIDETRRPGGVAGPIPGPRPYEDDEIVDHNIINLTIRVRWPFREAKTYAFEMERKWANVVVTRLNQINTFSGKFKAKIGSINSSFRVKVNDLKEKFKTTWKK